MKRERTCRIRRWLHTCIGAAAVLALFGAAADTSAQNGPLILGAQANVTPDGTGTSAPANSSGNTATFTVQNTGTANGVFTLTCSYTANVSGCTVQGTVSVNAGQSQPVNVTYSTGTAGQGTVTLQASVTGSSDTGYYVVTITSPGPVIDLTPHNGSNLDLSLCSTCFPVTLTYSTVPYVSWNSERSLTLVYNSMQAYPIGIVSVDASDAVSPAPDKMSILLKNSSGAFVAFLNGSTEIFYTSGTSAASRLVAAFNATTLATGAYDYTVVVRSWRSGVMSESTASVKILIVNRQSGEFGAGWGIAGLQRVYVQGDGSLLFIDGDGSAAYFQKTGSTWSAPAGDFSTATVSGTSYYYRTYPDGTKLTFNYSDGLMTTSQSRFAPDSTHFGYTSGRLTSVKDAAGKVITLAYDANSKLDYINDPGSPVRQTQITVSSGDLTQITDPDGVRNLLVAYTSHRVTSYTDRANGVWTPTYSYVYRLATLTTPKMMADSAAPVIGFRSIPDSVLASVQAGKGSSANPADRMAPANAKARTTDPRGYVTRMTADRFGAPLSVTDALARVFNYDRNTNSQVTREYSSYGADISYTWTGPDLTQVTNSRTGEITYMSYSASLSHT